MNTPKNQLIADFDKAFITGDIDFLLANSTDDIRWDMVGYKVVEGKEDFATELKAMKNDLPESSTVDKLISHGRTAFVNGTLVARDASTGDLKNYSFCDVYELSRLKDPLIKEVKSYVVEAK